MYIRNTETDYFYACPKYNPDEREEYERPCINHISINEYQHMLETFSEKIQEKEEDGSTFFAKNLKFKTKNAEYKILVHTPRELVISVLNKQAKNKMGI